MKHAEKHPSLDVPGCFGCRVASVSIASSATPSRSPGAAHAKWANDTEKRWHKDMDAFARLRRDGLQPERIDGCARLEQEAKHRVEIEGVHS